MSFLDFIEKLRKKPRYVRVQIMWLVVGLCMVIIFAAWLWSLDSQIKLSANQTSKEKGILESWGEFKKDIPSLWQSLGAGISNLFKSVEEELKNSAPAESVMPSATEPAPPSQMLPAE